MDYELKAPQTLLSGSFAACSSLIQRNIENVMHLLE